MHARIRCNCNHNLAFHQSLCQGAGHKQDMALPVLSMSYHTRFTCCFFLPFLQQFNSFNLEYSAHPLYEVRTQYNNCKLNLQIENQQFTCVVIDAINKARNISMFMRANNPSLRRMCCQKERHNTIIIIICPIH
jgi:hypothetical protein